MCKVELLGNIEEENKHQSGNIYGVGGGSSQPNGRYSWMGYGILPGDKENRQNFIKGIDLHIPSEIVTIANCIVAKYDSSIVKHKHERTGILEIQKINKNQVQSWIKK